MESALARYVVQTALDATEIDETLVDAGTAIEQGVVDLIETAADVGAEVLDAGSRAVQSTGIAAAGALAHAPERALALADQALDEVKAGAVTAAKTTALLGLLGGVLIVGGVWWVGRR